MLFEIDLHSGVPIYRQVIEQIQRQVLTGELVEGQQLESVRELAGRLKVNPMTISKAYSLLEGEGLLERRRGVGLFVAKMRQGQKEKSKRRMLDGALDKAAVTAVQLGVSQEQMLEEMIKAYREYDLRKRKK